MKQAVALVLFLCVGLQVGAPAADLNALLQAVEDGNVEKVRELLKNGADPNATAESGETAMHFAAWNENIPLLELLLENGGAASLDIREKDHNGTPLEWVTFKGRPAIVKLLLDHGSKVYDLDWQLATKFAANGPPEFLKETKKEDYALIIEHFKAAGFSDRQDLFSACERGDVEMAKRLLAANPDSLHAQTKAGDEFGEGKTPLLFAASSPSRQILEMLVEAGAPLDATDKEGNSALHLAAAAGAWQCIGLLLDRGTPNDAKNGAGKTPLELAVEKKKWLAVELLVQAGATVNDTLKSMDAPRAITTALKGGQCRIVLGPISQ